MSVSSNHKGGFSLLEILLVVAAVAILAGIVIVAINPGQALADTNNAKRQSDVTNIVEAIVDYTKNNQGERPEGILTGSNCAGNPANEICVPGGDCEGKVDLSILAENGQYLTDIPKDPSNSDDNRTGYFVELTANGRVTVCAPHAERGKMVEVTR